MYPIALSPTTATEFLEYLLCHHVPPTTLVICGTREAYIRSLQIDMQAIQSHDDDIEPDNKSSHSRHQFLAPKINLIAASRTISLAFAPTLLHLRAYLAAYDTKYVAPDDTSRTTSRCPTFAVWGLAMLHSTTMEYSMQGISRTLTAAIQAAQSSHQRLVLGETPVNSNHIDIVGAEESRTSSEPWDCKVPLLSGSVRLAIGESTGAGKTIEIRRVIGRWCCFVRLKKLTAMDDA